MEKCSLITVNWVLPLSTESSRSSLNICSVHLHILSSAKKIGRCFAHLSEIRASVTQITFSFLMLLWRLQIICCVSKTLIPPAISKNFLLWNIHNQKTPMLCLLYLLFQSTLEKETKFDRFLINWIKIKF